MLSEFINNQLKHIRDGMASHILSRATEHNQGSLNDKLLKNFIVKK